MIGAGTRRAGWQVLTLGLLLVAAGCGGAGSDSDDTTETTSPATTATTATDTTFSATSTSTTDTTTTLPGDATVGCMNFEVKRGPEGSLAEVTPCNLTASPKVPLDNGELVSVDAAGQAVVDVDGCGLIYVFMGSSLQRSGCTRDSGSSGSTFCALSGTSQMQNECLGVLQIETPSAVVLADGTVFSVSYDPDTQVTVVTAYEDSVTVFPLTELNGDMGEGAQIEPGAFYFTAPDERLGLAKEVVQLEPRLITNIEALPFAVSRLGLASEYNAVASQLIIDDIRVLDPRAIPVVNVRAAGGPFSNPDLRVGIASAVNWVAQSAVLIEQGIAVSLLFEGEEVASAGSQVYNPELGRAILEAFVDEGLEIAILAVASDDDAAAISEGVAAELAEFGVKVQLGLYDSAALLEGGPYQDFIRRVAAEQPTLWISSSALTLDN